MAEDAFGAIWQIAPPDPDAASALAGAVGVSPLIGQCLLNRQIGDAAAAEPFLQPCLDDLLDPSALPGLDAAVARLAIALERKERIFVHGDYDVDGVTSTALCLRALIGLGADVVGFVPSRSDGYDLQTTGVDRAKAAGASLILTADCGSCAIEPIAYARTLGMDVIVTDHHRPGPTLPDAVAVVNPYREDASGAGTTFFRELCGAGVAFKVLDALTEKVAPQHRGAFRKNFVEFVALGTVADMTPLCGENRILVACGLAALSATRRTGLRALLAHLHLENKPLGADNIGWHIAPRLNAAGRMEDADLAYRLLITRDANEAAELVAALGELVLRSREEIARVTTEAMIDALSAEHSGRRVLVLAREKWGKGVVGVAAGRIVDRCRRPVILLAYDAQTETYHGSARSFGTFNLHQALHSCADLLSRFGGHSAAAGVAIPAIHLAAFRDRMHDLAEEAIGDEPILPTIEIDAEVDQGGALTYDFAQQLQRLAPFGMGNPEPTFATYGAVVLRAWRAGKDNDTFLLNLRLPGASAPFKAVWFRNGVWADRIGMGDEIDLVYTPVINSYQGRVSVELSIRDLRSAAPAAIK